MKINLLFKSLVAALVAVTVFSGCKEGGPSTKVFVKKATGQRMRVAVLPFDNVSRDQDAGRVITSTVITYLLSTGEFDVVEPGVIYAALGSEGIRLTEGITQEVCQKLQPKLNADAFIVGLVEEYGEVRIGPDSYPSISFSTRLVDARTADILWAATISKTGAENVKIFDIGRVSSLGKLSKMAVKAMADSLAKSRDAIWSATSGSMPKIEQVGAGDTPSAAHGTVTSMAQTPAPQAARYTDESAAYGEKELAALLKDVGAAKLDAITYKKHYHDTVETKYRLEDGKFIEVKLVDYRKTATSEKFIRHDHPGEQQSSFEALPAFAGTSDFGYHHLDLAVGRFGLFLRGPKDRKGDIEALGKGIISLLK